MLINTDLVRAKEKPGKSKCREVITKLGWPLCGAGHWERSFYAGAVTHKPRQGLWYGKWNHIITLSARENIPFTKGSGLKQVGQVSDSISREGSGCVSLSLLPTPNSDMGEIQMCVRSDNSMRPPVPWLWTNNKVMTTWDSHCRGVQTADFSMGTVEPWT